MTESNSLVIPLEKLTPPTKLFVTNTPLEYISQTYPKALSFSFTESLVNYGNHPVLQGFIDAFKQHRPVTISPDIIWLLIIQGFAHHVLNNAEALRKKFVNFTGKQQLDVYRDNMCPESATRDDWQGIFADFVEQISSYVGDKLTETLSPCFTTTTPVSLAVGQLSIMCAMKKYFDYSLYMCGCGIPSVTVEGTVEDWEKIVDKLEILRKYDLAWWIDVIQPHIKEIVSTKKGAINKAFWLEMVRYKNGRGFYDPAKADGWLMSFFPYNKYGDKMYLDSISDINDVPSEILKVPFNLILYFPGQDPKKVPPTKCEFLAGFIGLKQDPNTFNIKPEIGWIVQPEKESDPSDFVESEFF